MPFSWTWDVNPVTLLAYGGAVWGGVRAWFGVQNRLELIARDVQDAKRACEDACAKAKAANQKVDILKEALHVQEVSEALMRVTREDIEKIYSRIERLSERMEKQHRELFLALQQRTPNHGQIYNRGPEEEG